MRASSSFVWVSFVVLLGCGGENGGGDAGRDAGGRVDSGASDAGSQEDAGVDAGPNDAGSGDDAGSTDAGSGDAGSSDAGTNDAGSGTDGGDACGFVDGLVRGCSADANCVVAVHQTDCCGNEAAIGINHSARVTFDAAEAACRATYPACGCPVGPIQTDSGETTGDASAIQVACVSRGPAGVCMTYVTTRPPDGV